MVMMQGPRIELFDLVICLADAVDLVSPALTNHHKQVAYIACSIAEELGMAREQQDDLMLAGALHDIGSFSLRERLDIMQFRFEESLPHAELGYLLLRIFSPLARAAEIIRFHHLPWRAVPEAEGTAGPQGSHILHLADRVAVLVDRRQEILGQAKGICKAVEEESGGMFAPEVVSAFRRLADREHFWLDIAVSSLGSLLAQRRLSPHELDAEGLLSLARLFTQIIDFRSPLTATHSAGVAAAAETLARLTGFSDRECRSMRIAGYLHDLGKLAVPAEILEKNTGLTPEEFNVIRSHTFYTYRLLDHIGALDEIKTWGAFHHERMDGRGYPFHLRGEELSLGSRIMAVADVFTALTEDRIYRQGMARDEVLRVLGSMCESGALDPGIVSVLRAHSEELTSRCEAAHEDAAREYREFRAQAEKALTREE